MRLVWAAMLALAQPAFAQSVAPEDARAVRAVIEAQLDAFKRDDAARAFSFASPGIRSMFDTPVNFMQMVRSQYAVVYRPASVTFGEARVLEGQLTQMVVFTDAQAQRWLALYPMERQPDGSWRIDGCILERAEARRGPAASRSSAATHASANR